MPTKVEREIAARGGAVRFRTLKRGGKVLREAVVRQPGPRGGRTIVWEPKKTSGGHRSSKSQHHSRRDPPRGFFRWFFKGRVF